MPTFCRHNRLVQNCPICSREQNVELRPVVSSGAPRVADPRPRRTATSRRPAAGARSPAGMRVRRLERGADDGYRSPLVQGLKSSEDAERLADELAFAATRLRALDTEPPGLYAEVGAAGDIEERTWLAFLIAYLCPLDAEDPFATISRVRTTWASGLVPELEGAELGPVGAHEPGRGTLEAYRGWAERASSQSAAFAGEPAWTPERRFARVFERLALPGLHRDARYDLLVTLGHLGCYELRAGALAFGGDNEVTVAAKRAFGIGDPLLLERRAAELASVCGIPLEALDLALFNWGGGTRARRGLALDSEPDDDLVEAVRAALAG
ncbi:MAG TPA: hypothetical protein VMD48_14630 [Solirubrobacteraceae bacterium]|nr:hypothetical protein [Solirubrobacteraceae bacterium]